MPMQCSRQIMFERHGTVGRGGAIKTGFKGSIGGKSHCLLLLSIPTSSLHSLCLFLSVQRFELLPACALTAILSITIPRDFFAKILVIYFDIT
jgi:hypothetical protein